MGGAGSCLTYSGRQSRSDRINLHYYEQKDLLRKCIKHVVRVVFANGSGFDAPIGVVLAWEERGSCLNYSGRQIAVGSQKPSRITWQNCCASESNTSVRVVFANGSAFDAPIGVVMAWEERGSCLNIFRTTSRGRISETFTNYEAKDLLRKQMTCCASESNTSVRVVFANGSGFDAPIGVVMAWEKRGSCLIIFRTTNRGRISETFTNYEAKDLLRKCVKHVGSRYFRERKWCVDHVLTYSGRQNALGSQKPSRITRQKTCCASESNTSVRVVFANGSGFDAPIGVVMAWEERGSCLIIFRTTNRGRISETFTNYEAKDLLRKCVKHVGSRYFRERKWRQKTCCASESNTSVRVVFANGSGFDAPIAVVLAWEECGSCLNIFRTTNCGRISETFTNYEAKDLLRKQKACCASESNTSVPVVLANGSGFDARLESSWHGMRSVDHVLTYSGRQIAVGSQKPSLITRQKTCCASESNTSVRVVFANGSGFEAPIGVVLAWEERGSCLNIFRTTNCGRISEIFMNYEAKDLLRKQKTCCASESNTSVRVVFANGSGFDAPIGVVLAWEERGSCLNIFRKTSRGRISETFTNYEAKGLLRKRVKTSVPVVFANGSAFDAPIGVVMAWEERGSCLNIFRTSNRGRITETFMNYEAKGLLRKQKTCCASESNTSVRVVFANGSGFDAPIGVVLAWEERGSCLNIFRTTNRSRISETFTNYEAKDLLRKCVKHVGSRCIRNGVGVVLMLRLESSWHGERGSCLNIVRTTISVGSQKPSRITRQRLVAQVSQTRRFPVVFANRSGFDARLEVVLAWESVGSCLNIFRRQIAVGSQKPSRITRQKTCCASESNTSVRVVFANGSGFDAPIGVVLAWEERGSCLIIFRTTNRGRISETFTNYEAIDLLRK
ncbi:uncharacterized protein G2W53_009765 [Senna tora]|uniref:Uncharacterized protein n=1 Tax=Senna tora TaxID=362788 RepID=A0A834WYP5_9FABA|nr:uncharacterized protein G2W53_009765 [Senna tora]